MTEHNSDANTAFLQARPEWNHEWHLGENDRVVILVPKFGNHWFGRWMMSKMEKPKVRLKLDDIGSFVWQKCDGNNSVEQIARALSQQFGENVDPVYERLNLFFQNLAKSNSVKWLQ